MGPASGLSVVLCIWLCSATLQIAPESLPMGIGPDAQDVAAWPVTHTPLPKLHGTFAGGRSLTLRALAHAGENPGHSALSRLRCGRAPCNAAP